MNATEPIVEPRRKSYRVLALDGGGAKGFYTLGVLKEVEALFGGEPLSRHFDLVFGTSTGSIIAALLALGKSVKEIHDLYKKHVPTVMKCFTRRGRTKALDRLAVQVFGNDGFDKFQMAVGIVATRWQMETPMIFKPDVAQAHGRAASFVPGFGCTIASAVRASCSAYPYFKRAVISTSVGERVEVIDGGYCANNPTLYAIADALKELQQDKTGLRVLSVGVGVYPEPTHWSPNYVRSYLMQCVLGFSTLQLLQKTLNVNTASMEQLRAILFKDIRTVRVNDRFSKPELATDLLESDLVKLDLLYQEGIYSFGQQEAVIRELLEMPQNHHA